MSYDIHEDMIAAFEDWQVERKAISEAEDEARRTVWPEEWMASDDQAVAILREVMPLYIELVRACEVIAKAAGLEAGTHPTDV